MKISFASPTLIVVCGWAVSGKTTIAKIIAERLRIHRIDIDEVRHLCIGLPYPHPNESPEFKMRDEREMKAAYELLLRAADLKLGLRESVIIAATFSRRIGQENLAKVLRSHPRSQARIIQCIPKNDPRTEIETRLSRGFGTSYVGGVNSYERYLEVKDRFEPIALPHIELDTSPPNTPEECAVEALAYILIENRAGIS